jgi:CHAT domain-containing protein/tetratricopeptide (TPR) repeat protein
MEVAAYWTVQDRLMSPDDGRRMQPIAGVRRTVLLVMFVCVVAAAAIPAHTAMAQSSPPITDAEMRVQAEQLLRAGVAQAGRRDFAAALLSFARARDLFHQIGDRGREGLALHNIGFTYDDLGQYQQALSFYEQALPLRREAGDRNGEAETLNNIGLDHHDLGHYPQALEFLQQALTIRRADKDAAGESGTLSNIGEVYRRLGRYQQALQLFQEALAIERRLRDRAAEGVTLNNIAALYADLGQYEQALGVYEQALAIRREVKDRVNEGLTLSNIGFVYTFLGQQQRALQVLQEALAIRREVKDRAGERVTLHNIGGVYNDLGQYEQALPFFQEALAIERESGDSYDEGVTLSSIGLVHHGLGRDDEALTFYEQALAIQRVAGDRFGEGVTLHNMGITYERLGNLEAAQRSYQQAIAISETLREGTRAEALQTSLTGRFARIYDHAVLLEQRLGHTAGAFALSERARARTFLDQLGNTRLDVRRGADARLVQQEQELRAQLASLDLRLRTEQSKGRQASATAVRALQDEREAQQRAYDAVLTQLQVGNPEYAALVSVSPLSGDEVQRLLPPDTMLVAYYVTDTQTLAFVVTRDALHMVALPVQRAQLAEAVTSFRGQQLREAAPPSLAVLSEWLVAPLAPFLTAATLLLVPHDVLHTVPFAALRSGNRYLGDAHRLAVLPSASALPFIQQHRKPLAGTPLVVAQTQAPGLPTLQAAAAEARQIAALYDTRPLQDAATAATVRADAGAHPILHLAAHGQLNADRPLFSRILLAPAPDGGDDGSLTVQDVYGLNLARTDLVVLSACETQLGARSAGDDIVGLTRAFLYAGASSVVASLWKVDDAATARFMTAFYTHLNAGMSKAAALRAAQADTRARYPEPYYWAAFVLTGDPGVGWGDGAAAAPDGGRPLGRWIAAGAGGALAALLGGLILRRRRGNVPAALLSDTP